MKRRSCIRRSVPCAAFGLAAWIAGAALAGEPLREVQPGSARKPGTAPTGPAAPVPERLPNLPSLGPGISPGSLPDAPVVAPYQPNKPDPEMQRQMLLLMDKRRNWLLENAAKLNTKADPKAKDDLFSESRSSKASLEKIAADRLRRATERPDAPGNGTSKDGARTAEGTPADPNAPDAGLAELDGGAEKDGLKDGLKTGRQGKQGKDETADDPTKPKAPLAFVTGSVLDADRSAESAKSSFASDVFLNPGGSALDDRSKERLAARGSEFDQILGSIGVEKAAGGGGGLDLGRAMPDRARQFESLLSGTDPVASPAASVFANPLASAAAAAPGAALARPDLSPGLGRVNPIQVPGAPAFVAPAPAPRFQAAPVFLQIPTRGL